MSVRIKYTNEPIGEPRVIKDFLPAPSELAFRDEDVKITIQPLGDFYLPQGDPLAIDYLHVDRGGFGAGESSPLAVASQMFAPAEAPEDPAPGGDPRAQDPRLVDLRETLAEVPGVVRADTPVKRDIPRLSSCNNSRLRAA